MIIEIQYAYLEEKYAGTPLHQIQIGGFTDFEPWRYDAMAAREKWKFEQWQFLIEGKPISFDEPADIERMLKLPPLPPACTDLDFPDWPLGPIGDTNRHAKY